MALFLMIDDILARDDIRALAPWVPEAAGKITGMMLEGYTPEVLQGVLDSPTALAERVAEALRLLADAAPGGGMDDTSSPSVAERRAQPAPPASAPTQPAPPPAANDTPAETGAPPSPPTPPTRVEAARAAVEILRTRRRRSENWAADWLRGEDGDYLRQPSIVPILDGVPYGCRAYVISRYCQCIRDLRWAVEAHGREQTEASNKRVVGAWVVLLRVFPLSLGRDQGGGGDVGARRARAIGRVWDEGDYSAAMAKARSKKAVRREGKSAPSIAKLFKRVTKYGRQGKISRMCAAFTAAMAAPGDERTLTELKQLAPSLFVPAGCPRRARIAERVAEISRSSRITFKEQHLVPALSSMPKSATTWATAGLMKCVIRTKDGVRQLTWLLETMANAQVPDEVRCLIFDSKRAALEKDSQHQLSIERLVARAEGQAAPAADGASPADNGAPVEHPQCDRCGHRHSRGVGCAPAIWAGESPDVVPEGVRRPPTAAELQMAADAQVRPHPRLACCSGPGGGCCAECAAVPERPQFPSSTKRPIDIRPSR